MNDMPLCGRSPCRGKRGFSLIEITLAIMVFATGVVVVFALFPETLEMSRRSVEDTHVGLFGSSTLAGIRANAAEVTNWTVWTTPASLASLKTELLRDLPAEIQFTSSRTAIRYPNTNGVNESYVRYTLVITNVTADGALKSVVMEADGTRSGPFLPSTFYTELYFRGSVPR